MAVMTTPPTGRHAEAVAWAVELVRTVDALRAEVASADV